ncbi:hypothetical protein C0U44_27970, partial [Klebsiella pneumoniae]
MSAEPHIVIIGGGFSGAAVAIELLRLGAERGARDAAGAAPVPRGRVAYSTAEPTHRIKRSGRSHAAGRDEEGAFDHWYRHQPAFTVDVQALRPDGSVYPQRGQFGRYVAQRFADAAASSGGRLRHLRDRALAFEEGAFDHLVPPSACLYRRCAGTAPGRFRLPSARPVWSLCG